MNRLELKERRRQLREARLGLTVAIDPWDAVEQLLEEIDRLKLENESWDRFGCPIVGGE